MYGKNRCSSVFPTRGFFILLFVALALTLGSGSVSAKADTIAVSSVTETRQVPGSEKHRLAAGKVTRKYYSQLNTRAKKVYNTLKNTNLRKKNPVAKVKTPLFTADSYALRSDNYFFSLPEIASITLDGEAGIYAYRLDHMDQCYWMSDINISVVFDRSSDTGGTVKMKVKGLELTPVKAYSSVLNDDGSVRSAIKKAVRYVKSHRKTSSRYNTLLAIAGYLTKNFSYGKAEALTSYTPAGVLLSKFGNTGVCEAYAKTFFILCRQFDIPVIYVESRTHAYNYVKMGNNKWYGMDVTWMDEGNGKMDMQWFLYGSSAAVKNDYRDSHVTLLSRAGVVFEPINISSQSYPQKS